MNTATSISALFSGLADFFDFNRPRTSTRTRAALALTRAGLDSGKLLPCFVASAQQTAQRVPVRTDDLLDGAMQALMRNTTIAEDPERAIERIGTIAHLLNMDCDQVGHMVGAHWPKLPPPVAHHNIA